MCLAERHVLTDIVVGPRMRSYSKMDELVLCKLGVCFAHVRMFLWRKAEVVFALCAVLFWVFQFRVLCMWIPNLAVLVVWSLWLCMVYVDWMMLRLLVMCMAFLCGSAYTVGSPDWTVFWRWFKKFDSVLNIVREVCHFRLLRWRWWRKTIQEDLLCECTRALAVRCHSAVCLGTGKCSRRMATVFYYRYCVRDCLWVG